MNTIALSIIQECIDNKYAILELGCCGLTDEDFESNSPLNQALGECTHLQKLILSTRWFYWDPPGSGIIVESKNYNKPNKLTKAPSALSKLTNLTELIWGDVENNHYGISDISFLGSLTKLKRLDLSYNRITDIKVISQLHSLQQLDLSCNSITDITPLLGFLQRKENPLKIALSSTAGHGYITLQHNQLKTPPVEVVSQGRTAVLNYFEEISKHDFDYLYEAKMLIVGQPRAGKTALRLKLFDVMHPLPGEEQTTRGIDIMRLNFDIIDLNGKKRKFYYNVWDFAGQQIYQTTHQFFLTNRSLYILVVDSGKDDMGGNHGNINYWLQMIELHGKDSPLLLLLNEKNGRSVILDFVAKQSRFGFLKNQYNIDLNALIAATQNFNYKQLNNFKIFKEDVETKLSRLPLVGFAMPKNWVDIRKELQTLSRTISHITNDDYIEICSRFEVTDYGKQMELSKIFHDLGVFLHFQEHPALEDIIILQNTWATDAVFAVLDDKTVESNFGKFSDKDLPNIWHRDIYTPKIYNKLLALMLKFELCYRLEKDESATYYIIPEMLPGTYPSEYKWQAKNDRQLHYKYDFMPTGIITRLIVRLHKHIYVDNKIQMVWKTGVKIDGNSMDCLNTYAEITEAWDNEKLFIKVQGENARDLMSKLTYQIDELNNEIFSLSNKKNDDKKWTKMIPCICEECKNDDKRYYFPFNQLQKAKQKKKENVECQHSFQPVPLNDLIEGYHFGGTGASANPKKIFISYSRHDEKWLDQLRKNLAPLQNQQHMITWVDKEIESGMWEYQVEKAMDNADIFIFLVTHNFLSSPYITQKEISRAYTRYKQGSAKIVPVICEPCLWQEQPVSTEKVVNTLDNREMYLSLGMFQAFPQNGVPIQKWEIQQDAFLDAVTNLKKLL